MGLKMSEKRSITRETVARYRKADKKGKQKILDEFTKTTGYNRKYAIHLLSNWGKETLRIVYGKLIKFVVGKHVVSNRTFPCTCFSCCKIFAYDRHLPGNDAPIYRKCLGSTSFPPIL